MIINRLSHHKTKWVRGISKEGRMDWWGDMKTNRTSQKGFPTIISLI